MHESDAVPLPAQREHESVSERESGTSDVEQFDVVILGFTAREESPERALMRVFGIEAHAALSLVEELPVVVQRGANRVRAEYYRKALEMIGAQVELRDPHAVSRANAARAASRPPPPPAASQPPPSVPGAPDAHAPVQFAPIYAPAALGSASVRPPAHPTVKESQPASLRAPSPAPLAPAPRSVPPSTFRFGHTDPPYAANTNAAASAKSPLPPSAAVPKLAGWGDIDIHVKAPAPAAPHKPLPVGLNAQLLSNDPLIHDEQLMLYSPAPPAVVPLRAQERAISSNPPAANAASAANAPRSERAPAPAYEQRGLSPLDRSNPEEVFDSLRKMSQAERWKAPGAQTMAEARRKQALLGAQSSLGGDGEGSPSMRPELASQRPSQRAIYHSVNAPKLELQSMPAVAPRARASQQRAQAKSSSAPALRSLPPASFWDHIPAAFSYAWLGHGKYWIAIISAISIAIGFVCALIAGVPFVGIVPTSAVLTIELALCAELHSRVFSAVLNDEPELEGLPDFASGQFRQVYLRAASPLFWFFLVSQLPLVLWTAHHLLTTSDTFANVFAAPTFWLCAIVPALYWPLALACAAQRKDYAGVWQLGTGFGLLAKAPLECCAISLLGAGTFAATFFVLLSIGWIANLPSAFCLASLGLPMALSHGVLGALTAQLVRAEPTLFE